jgi:signal transduction histidine kinase/sensor domain CHASE-containing protein
MLRFVKSPRFTPFPPGVRRRAGLAATLCALIIVCLTYLLWHWSIIFLNLRLQEASWQSSEQTIARLESFLEARMVALRRVAQFCVNSDNLLEQEFVGFTTDVLADVPGFLDVIRLDTSGVPVWQSPHNFLARSDLFQITGDPQTQQALRNAITSAQLVVTNAVEIPGHGTGFLVAMPLQRVSHNEGFLLGVFTYQDLLNILLVPDLLQHYRVGIAHAGRVIFPALGGASLGFDSAYNRLANRMAPYQLYKPTYIGGQSWEIWVDPIDPPTTPQSFASISILMLGFTLALALSWIVYKWVVRTGLLQAEASQSRKRLEDTGVSLVEIKAELDLIFNSVDEGIVLYDANANPVQANTPFLSMFGLGENALPGETAFPRGASRKAHHEHMAQLAGSESRYLALFRALQRHPEQIYTDELELHSISERPGVNRPAQRNFLRRAMAISGADGERRGLLVIYKEVTSIKSIERAKDEFLAGVTHELRSPLSAIKGFAETLRRDAQMPEPTRQEFIGIICEEAERLQNLIEELLDLRRMEASGIPLKSSGYDLQTLAREVASSARTMLLAKNISLRLEWGEAEDCRFSGDPGQISRAVRNLLVNAIKYSPQGGEILLRGHCGAKAGWIEVSDQGIGIAEADLPHIFDKFYRAKSQGRQQGTGLGLAIVKHIVELHGGHIGVRSEIGHGTTFHLELPRQFRPPSQALLGAGSPGGEPGGEPTDEPTTEQESAGEMATLTAASASAPSSAQSIPPEPVA